MTFSLIDIFNDFANRAVRDFPQLEGHFSIYSAPTDTLHGSFPPEESERLRYVQKDQILKFKQTNGTTPHGYATHDGDYSLINYIEERTDRHKYITRNDPYEIEVRAAMEHELAHLVVTGASPGKGRAELFTECVAEAFSFLRQMQQFGSISNQVEEASYMQANIAVLKGDTSHFCVPVIHEVGRIADTYDLKKLTPQQTANMAYRLAVLYTPSNPELRELEAAFRPTLLAFHDDKKRWEMPMFEACANATLQHNSSLVHMCGKAFLEPFLHKRSDIIPTTLFPEEELAGLFNDDEWTAIRGKLQHQSPSTSEESFKQEARDMMAFGKFDKNSDKEIKPAVYESAENLAYLERAQNIYTAVRYFQETGKRMSGIPDIRREDITGLDHDAIAAMARARAVDTPAVFATPSYPTT